MRFVEQTIDKNKSSIMFGLRCGLSQEGIFVESVCCVAVEGARLHGDTFNVTVGLLCQVECLEHPEAWNTTDQELCL